MYKTIEELVTRVDERNNDGIVSELIGVSIDTVSYTHLTLPTN